MQRRDLLKDQIEQLGKVLAKMLDSFFSLKSKGQVGVGIEQTEQALKEELNIDLEELISLPEKDLKQYFENRNYTNDHITQLARLLLEYAEFQLGNGNKEKAKLWLNKIRLILQLDFTYQDSFLFTELPPSSTIFFENKNIELEDRINKLLAFC